MSTSKSSSVANGNSSSSHNGDWSAGTGLIPGRDILGPLFLMTTTPCFSIIFFHVCVHLQGNFLEFGRLAMDLGFFNLLQQIWPDPWDVETWTMIASFAVFQLLLMRFVPGKSFQATLTPKGNRPTYTANGMACYLITLVTLIGLSVSGVWNPARVYDKFGNILSSMNVFALVFCTALLVKGYVAPSSTDSGSTGNLVQDFYWGMELYPRFFGWDVKQFTNCRMGMMFWAVAILCFAYKNMQLHGGQLQFRMAVSVALQLIYITKFFHWEMGYMCSMDIQHDRAGYYICWGCLVWVPAVYTSPAFYLTASQATDVSPNVALAIFLAGFLCIWINYDSDHQRYVFRQTQGNCRIWGRVPKKIVAYYKTSRSPDKPQQSLLLVDGWWKFARHFHYVPEILASFFWSVSAGFSWSGNMIAAYFYVVYLTILLTDRAYRDDDRCRSKYGPYWEQYCTEVPYKIVPGVV